MATLCGLTFQGWYIFSNERSKGYILARVLHKRAVGWAAVCSTPKDKRSYGRFVRDAPIATLRAWFEMNDAAN
jgi:hypothetical protein